MPLCVLKKYNICFLLNALLKFLACFSDLYFKYPRVLLLWVNLDCWIDEEAIMKVIVTESVPLARVL